MITRMTHPEHGAYDAYSPAEIEACKAKGWSVAEVQATDTEDEPAIRRRGPNKVKE